MLELHSNLVLTWNAYMQYEGKVVMKKCHKTVVKFS